MPCIVHPYIAYLPGFHSGSLIHSLATSTFHNFLNHTHKSVEAFCDLRIAATLEACHLPFRMSFAMLFCASLPRIRSHPATLKNCSFNISYGVRLCACGVLRCVVCVFLCVCRCGLFVSFLFHTYLFAAVPILISLPYLWCA